MSGYSQSPSSTRSGVVPTANSAKKITATKQVEISFASESVQSGSFDDAAIIRGVLIQSIKRSGKSRAAIAEEMEYLLARTVTDAMLNAFTADREDRRWPAEFDRAFCKATGDNSLLACRAEMAGLHVINDEEKDLMELGRQFLLRSQADEQIALLQRRLHGRVA